MAATSVQSIYFARLSPILDDVSYFVMIVEKQFAVNVYDKSYHANFKVARVAQSGAKIS
jgi:hypothetical protein